MMANLDDMPWGLQDFDGEVHGPFDSAKMAGWADKGYFQSALQVRVAPMQSSGAGLDRLVAVTRMCACCECATAATPPRQTVQPLQVRPAGARGITWSPLQQLLPQMKQLGQPALPPQQQQGSHSAREPRPAQQRDPAGREGGRGRVSALDRLSASGGVAMQSPARGRGGRGNRGDGQVCNAALLSNFTCSWFVSCVS